jgi:hypothetical protein
MVLPSWVQFYHPRTLLTIGSVFGGRTNDGHDLDHERVPGSAETYTATGLTAGLTYYFVLWTGDEVPNWSEVSNTALVYLPVPAMVTLAEAVGQPGWIGQGETQRILGTAQVVSDSAAGVTVSSVAVRETGPTRRTAI